MGARRISLFAVIVGLTVLPAPAIAQPARQPTDTAAPPAAAADPSSTAPASTGLAQELAQRLAEGGNPAGADRDDRAALAKFYAGRQYEPVWTGEAGFTPAALAAAAEL